MNNSNSKLLIPSTFLENEHIKKCFQIQTNVLKLYVKPNDDGFLMLFKKNDGNKKNLVYSNYYKYKIFSDFLNHSKQSDLKLIKDSLNTLFFLKFNIYDISFNQTMSAYNCEGNEIQKNITDSVFGIFINQTSGIETDLILFLDKVSENLSKFMEKMEKINFRNINNHHFHEVISDLTNFNLFFSSIKYLNNQLQKINGKLACKRAELHIKKERNEKKLINLIEKLKYVLEVKTRKLLTCFYNKQKINQNDFKNSTLKVDFHFSEQKEQIIQKICHDSHNLKDNLKLLIKKRDQIMEKIKIIESIKKEEGKEHDLFVLIKRIKLNESDINLQRELLK